MAYRPPILTRHGRQWARKQLQEVRQRLDDLRLLRDLLEEKIDSSE